ncbi:hypothetical protein CTM76_17050 [Photobacterium phosphoreum]|uniref:ABC-three component system middle component 5 n=1 Tax=Photobacterium phosphoreum TaxID=659 RepID=UPI0007F8AA64|nr:ABC-three component system middle component 5 [Photobacterium phosphoreum]OBU41674.1 hypothetical protein AYY25_01000 [Photobacterium phosphoreum]PSU76095.1 hypothetical protein CTM76_17050 [Photobacterium phosphoreum]
MLLYNKAIDINHTIFRLTALLIEFDGLNIERERLQILDFILANPDYISRMTLGKDLIKERNKFKKYKNKYHIYNERNLFETMKPTFNMAITFFEFHNVVENNKITNRITVNAKNIPEDLISIINRDDNSISFPVITFIKDHLLNISLIGSNGLKAASNLIGYKYDAI